MLKRNFMPAHRQITDEQLRAASEHLAQGNSQDETVAWLHREHGVDVSRQALAKALRTRTESVAEVNRTVAATALSAVVALRARELDEVFVAQLGIVKRYQRKLALGNKTTLQKHASALKAHIASLVAITHPLFKAAGLEPSGLPTAGANGHIDVMANIRARILAEEEEAERLRNETLPDDDPSDFDAGPDDDGSEPSPDPAVEEHAPDEPTDPIEQPGMDAGSLAETA